MSAKQLEKMQYLHRATWKNKLKEIEASELKKIEVSEALGSSQVKKIEVSEALGSSQVKKIDSSFHQDPSPELDLEEFSDVDILDHPDKRRKTEKIKKLGGTPKQRREQIRATLLLGYCVCDSGKTRMRILHQLGSCSMVLGVDYFSFAHHGTVLPSPETYAKVCKWCASKATTKESDESDSSSTIIHDS